MIKEDYLMRQIEIIARTLAKLLFDKDSADYEIKDYSVLTDTDKFHSRLCQLINDRNLNEAENLLFEKIEDELEENPDGREYLQIAIDFYARLNSLSSRILDDCGFEREEIDEGIREVAELYGFNII